ncbi:MAG: lysophospholipid acyltransferase family protein [Deltaproteobacteria bacterium]|nr:lysophospholipid acyltransferase family protein [Deltaproteobacteria bacterium]
MMRWLSGFVLRLAGWKPTGEVPTPDRYVLIAAPHTTNWDLPVMLLFGFFFGMKVRWMGKHTIFKGPFGWFFRKLGGIPVDRRARNDTVEYIASLIRDSERMILAISPEGTRSRREHWKSGFYHIARAAGVPVACGVLDYARKEGGFGPTLELTGDVKADMDRFRAYYGDKRGLHPELFGPVRLRDETGVTAGAAALDPAITPVAMPVAEVAAGLGAVEPSVAD